MSIPRFYILHSDGLLEEHETWHKVNGYLPNETQMIELLSRKGV